MGGGCNGMLSQEDVLVRSWGCKLLEQDLCRGKRNSTVPRKASKTRKKRGGSRGADMKSHLEHRRGGTGGIRKK